MPLLVVSLGTALGAGGMAMLNPFGERGPQSPPSLTGHGSPRRPLDAQRVYDRLAPSVLDITAVLRYDNETAEGTGFVFDGAHDLVLTNNHVIKDSTSVTATPVTTGKTYRARVVGTDAAADIAVLRVEGPPRLTAAPMADSGAARLGDPVLVIGNQAGQGGPPAIAPGIINSLHRAIAAADGNAGFTERLRDMLQTSAKIEPGDSGGPLADSEGRVVGMDTAAGTGAGTAGFAIPVNLAVAVARRIAASRRGPGIVLGTGAFLGVLVVAGAQASPVRSQPQPSLTDRAGSGRHLLLSSVAGGPGRGPRKAVAVPGRGAGGTAADGRSCLDTESEAALPDRVAPIRYGALVEGVLCGTPAADSGLAAGDVITRAAGRPVPSPAALISIVAGCGPGTHLPLTWTDLRGSTRTELLRVAAAPAP